MSKDRFQDKYDEVFKDLKEEKMNWNFEDFLKKTEEKADAEPEERSGKVIPLPFLSKYVWIAASTAILAGLFFGVKYWNSGSQSVTEQDLMVKTEVEKQKGEIFNDNTFAATEDTLKVQSEMKDSLSYEVSDPDEVINKIVPKRGRMKKVQREKYVNNDKKNQPTEYQDDFVIINGHKITSEEEAINIAKYSFRMFSENVAKSVASSVVQEHPTED
ncbi:MAG: hypothetical protein QM564_04180 [Bergeyella sp.]